ncbi:MAG: hypothetical protein ACREOF_04190 [Gemmatimonadales bacterium]
MTALRLPDQFSPGALGATAATPTCCCCCCCCLASTLTTPIVLHGGLGQDLARVAEPERPERHSPARAFSAEIWVAALFAVVLIVINLDLPGDTLPIVVAAVVLGAAAAVSLVAAWAGSPRPAVAAVRLVVGAVAFAAEFYLILAGTVLVIPVIVLVAVALAVSANRR